MSVLEKEEIYTVENIYDLPEGERAELIDGRIYYMALPSTSNWGKFLWKPIENF